MAEHEHGSMKTDSQQKTFDGFMTFVTRAGDCDHWYPSFHGSFRPLMLID